MFSTRSEADLTLKSTEAEMEIGAKIRRLRSGRLFGVEDFEIPTKETADELSLLFDDMEGAVFDPVAEGNRSAHPDALPLQGGDLVADSLAGDLALELGEGQQHVQGQPSHAGVALKAWVTEMKETPCASNSSTSLAKSASDRVSRSTL